MSSIQYVSWEDLWRDICVNPIIIEEYKKAFLLNLFQKVCSKMEKDIKYKKHVNQLFLQSFSKSNTVKHIIEQTSNYSMSDEDVQIVEKWFDAYRKKSNRRRVFQLNEKKALYEKQQGLCAVCGNELGNNWASVHADHIIPWKLVGDELENNYQLLCSTCNECKSAKTDFLFKNLINLV